MCRTCSASTRAASTDSCQKSDRQDDADDADADDANAAVGATRVGAVDGSTGTISGSTTRCFTPAVRSMGSGDNRRKKQASPRDAESTLANGLRYEKIMPSMDAPLESTRTVDASLRQLDYAPAPTLLRRRATRRALWFLAAIAAAGICAAAAPLAMKRVELLRLQTRCLNYQMPEVLNVS